MKVYRAAAGLTLIGLLAACGGSNSSNPPPPSPPPAPTALSYPATPALTKGVAMAALTPTVTGSVTNYVIAPGLPAGLAINAATGVIAGTPTALQPATNYTVTASNGTGGTTATLSITVNDAPPTLSYPQSAYAFTIGTTALVVGTSGGGAVTNWSIDRPLPAGLTFSLGQISGVPTAISAASNYVITASNSGGSTTATLSIAVNDLPPTLNYPRSSYTFATGAPIVPVVPTTTGGAITNWSIDRTLPTGLAFDNGQISGTPTAASAASAYVVTASNSGGSATYSLTLAVQSAVVLLELGHTTEIRGISYVGNRVMSVDAAAHVLLNDSQTGARVFEADSSFWPCTSPCDASLGAQLAGNILAIRQTTGFEVYSAQTGALLTKISRPLAINRRWMLASDGSYIAEADHSGLSAWTVAGAPLLARAGAYDAALILALPGQLRVANSPGILQALEYISFPGGVSSQSPPYIGVFNSWFHDGARFLTRANNVVVAYSEAGLQLGSATVTTVEGLDAAGDWFWTHGPFGPLEIYAVAGGAPVASHATPFGVSVQASATALAMIPSGEPRISVVDLSNSALPVMDYATSTADNTRFAARSATDWVFGKQSGVLSGAPGSSLPVNYNYGAVRGIAAGHTRIAVAVASGEVLVFNASHQLEGSLAADSSKIALSSDGTVLGASVADDQSPTNSTVRIFSWPSKNVLAEWPAGTDFVLSGSGDVVGQTDYDSGTSTVLRHTMHLDSSVLWSDSSPKGSLGIQSFLISPSGLGVAAPNTTDFTNLTSTNIYTNGSLTGNTNGGPICWLAEGRLLINHHGTGPQGAFPYDGARIVNSSGQVLASVALPEMESCQGLDANTIYSSRYNTILDVNTGDTLWSSGLGSGPTLGAATDAVVASVFGTTVRVEPR